MIRTKHPGAYDDMDDSTLERNVLAKYPQYGDLPKTEATSQAQPEDVLTRTNRQMTAAMSGQTTMLTPEEKVQSEAGKKAGMKAAAETTGMMIGGEAMPVLKGLTGALLRIFGTGAGAGIGNIAGQVGTTGKAPSFGEAATEAAKMSAFTAGGEALGALGPVLGQARNYLRDLIFTPEGKITEVGKAMTHPLDSAAEVALRKSLGVPNAPIKGESVPIARSPNFNPEAYKAGRASINPPETPAATPSPFGNATSTQTPVGNAKLSDLAQGKTPPSPQVQMVSKFEPPSQGKIVSPESAPPDVKVTYQSVPQADLLKKVKGGDIFAIREWQRRGLQLPANVRFLTESAGAKPWRNLEQ
jgi:hypothetical protein